MKNEYKPIKAHLYLHFIDKTTQINMKKMKTHQIYFIFLQHQCTVIEYCTTVGHTVVIPSIYRNVAIFGNDDPYIETLIPNMETLRFYFWKQ